MSLFADARDYLHRKLQPGEPNTFVAGGGNLDDHRFANRDRERDQLEEWENAYQQGGPVSQLIDTRSYMTFGTGSEFVTEADDRTVPDPQTGDPLTVADWLNDAFPDRDNLFVTIGRDNYVYGDAFLEIVETRGNDFSHVVTVNPKTLEAQWDDRGQIRRWTQSIERQGQLFENVQTFEPDEISHIALHTIGRHPLGISLLGRNWDEVQRFAKNQEAIATALEQHAFTKWHVQVGQEGQTIDDNEMRRVRQRFKKIRNNDTYLTGRDVDINPLDTGGIGEGIANISENDLTMLAAGFGVPEEMAGLGRGSTEATAKVRLQAFERTARAEQRTLADQFVEEVVRPILEEYSPFPPDIDVTLAFGDVVSDQQAVAEWLRQFKGSYTHNEIRDKLGDGPVPDEADIDGDEVAVKEDTEAGGMGGGLFDLEGGPDTGNAQRALADGGEPWEVAFNDIIERVLWSDDTERDLFEFDPEDIPRFVKELLHDAIPTAIAESRIETLSDSQTGRLTSVLRDSLETSHGWSLDSIASNIQEMDPDLSDFEAERLGRDITSSAVDHAREAGYSERLDMDEETFYAVNPMNNRTTDACKFLVSETNPRHGGTPVLLSRYKELVQEANERDEDIDHDAREFKPHIQCRTTYVRAV